MEQKFAYPYKTKFKKEPFKSFVNVKRKNIGNYYLKEFNRLDLFKKYRGPRDYRTSTSPGYMEVYKEYTNVEEEKEEVKG